MVGQFLAGVIVGVLIGLALAPLLRSWISWRIAKVAHEREPLWFTEATTTRARSEP